MKNNKPNDVKQNSSTEAIVIFYYPILENNVIDKRFVKTESIYLDDFPNERLAIEDKWNKNGTICYTRIIKKKINNIEDKISLILLQKLNELKTEPFRKYPLQYPDKLIGETNHKYALQNGYFVACADKI